MPAQLFTLICEFDGGTYVSQLLATDERQALKEWAALLRREQPVPIVSGQIADCVSEDGDPPTPFEGLINVWCWTASVDGKLVLTNLVRAN